MSDALRAARDALANAEKGIATAIDARVRAGNSYGVEALRELVTWVPEVGFPGNCTPVYDDPPDEDCPFFTESFLYELLGKEDARTVLCLLEAVAHGLGTTVRELQWGTRGL